MSRAKLELQKIVKEELKTIRKEIAELRDILLKLQKAVEAITPQEPWCGAKYPKLLYKVNNHTLFSRQKIND